MPIQTAANIDLLKQHEGNVDLEKQIIIKKGEMASKNGYIFLSRQKTSILGQKHAGMEGLYWVGHCIV